jgi:fructose-1-phosphate kinase PfkB-like protein
VDYFVASGSLPPGVPYDLYAQMARVLKEKNIKMVYLQIIQLKIRHENHLFKPY